MKKISIFIISLLLIASTAFAIPPMPAGGLTNVTDCGKYATLQLCVDAAGSYGYARAPGTYTAGIALTNAHAGLTLDFGGSGYIHVVTGSAITVTGTSDTVRANHITIKNGRILTDDVAAPGILLTFADYGKYSNLYFNGSKYNSIRIHNSSYTDIGYSIFLNNANADTTTSGDIYIIDDLSPAYFSLETRIHDNVISGAVEQGIHVHFWAYSDANPQRVFIINNYINSAQKGAYLANGAYVISGNTLYGCGYAGLYGDAAYANIAGNLFSQNNIGIQMADAEGIITGNWFRNNTTNTLLAAWWGGKVDTNYFMGGANTEYALSHFHDSFFGNMTTYGSGYGTLFFGGGSGIGTKGYNLAAITSGSFSSVLPGDVLHLPYGNGGGIWRVKSVTDATDLVIEETYTKFPYPIGYQNYQIYRNVSYFDVFGNLSLSPNSIIHGGGHRLTENIIPAAVTIGSVATINSAPTAGGTGYAAGDLSMISTGSGNAIVKVLTVSSGIVQTVALFDSGQSGYTTGTGKATGHITGVGNDDLTINITAVGLSVAQVSDTIITNTGQASADITNYLPIAKAGYKFSALLSVTQTGKKWQLANNSGILNNASGDVMALAGVDGTAGSTHGIKDTTATKGDRLDCWTACIDATNGYYQWFCTAGTTTGIWAAY
jgi:hypothetical protein